MENKEEAKEKSWNEAVREELIEVIDEFLQLAESGGYGVKYRHPIKFREEGGLTIYDKEKLSGVDLYIQFSFIDKLVPAKEETL